MKMRDGWQIHDDILALLELAPRRFRTNKFALKLHRYIVGVRNEALFAGIHGRAKFRSLKGFNEKLNRSR
jgi:hypothetical protein